MKVLIFGAKGWIGQQVCNYCNEYEPDLKIIHAESRADNEVAVESELIKVKPDSVISLVGRTYGPGFSTIDYLEQKGKLVENLRDNLYAPMILALLTKKYNIHLAYLGTGCIFNGRNFGDENGYIESDKPDFFGSAYSTAKGFTDRLMHFMDDHVLNVRIRMPITDFPSPRNFITKMMNYQKICSIPNSMTVLPELIPVFIDMVKKKMTGTINLTNPGLITHNEILEMVREIIDPNLKWENFSLEEQREILLGERSNCFLDTTKLINLYPHVLPIKESVRKTILVLKENLDKGQS